MVRTIGVLRMMSRVFSVGATMITETWFAVFLLLCLSNMHSMDKGMLLIALSNNFSELDVQHISQQWASAQKYSKWSITLFQCRFKGIRYFVPVHSEASCRARTNKTSLCSDCGTVLVACSSIANFSLFIKEKSKFLFAWMGDAAKWYQVGSYYDSVLTKHNSISTEFPVVCRVQITQNHLNSVFWFVHVDRQLVSCYHLTFDSTHGYSKPRKSRAAKEFVLGKEECFFVRFPF